MEKAVLGNPIKYYKNLTEDVAFAKEWFKTVPEWRGEYEISTLGRVRSLPKRQNGYKSGMLKQCKSPYGYMYVMLKGRKHVFVHVLIAETFIKNPKNKPHVNHINGVKDDNYLWNLEWTTPSENAIHAFKHGLRTVNKTALGKTGALCWRSIPINQCTMNGTFIKTWDSIKDAAVGLGLSHGNIWSCLKGRYKYTGGFTFKYK